MAHVTNKCIKLVKKFEGLIKKLIEMRSVSGRSAMELLMQINLSQEQR